MTDFEKEMKLASLRNEMSRLMQILDNHHMTEEHRELIVKQLRVTAAMYDSVSSGKHIITAQQMS